MIIQKERKKVKGFTLVELVVVIAIVIILSVISVPIYRAYVDKAKTSEGYALLGAILSAQKAYYSEHGNFLRHTESAGYTSNEPVLGIDARGNKYFTWFHSGEFSGLQMFRARVEKSSDINSTSRWLTLTYNTTTGATFSDAWY